MTYGTSLTPLLVLIHSGILMTKRSILQAGLLAMGLSFNPLILKTMVLKVLSVRFSKTGF